MKDNATPGNETETLQEYGLLHPLQEQELHQFTTLATLVFNVPFSIISVTRKDQQKIISQTGDLHLSEIPDDWTFMQPLLEKGIPVIMEDISRDPAFRHHKTATTALDIRFFAGFPLTNKKGQVTGTFCVMDKAPHHFTAENNRALSLIAMQISAWLHNRRQKEEAKYYAKLFDLSNGLVCIAGLDGIFRRVNSAFSLLLGWDEAYLLHTPVLDMVHPDDVASTARELANLNAGLSTIYFSHRFKTKSGDYKFLQWVATPEPITGTIFAIGRDITGEKTKEAELTDSENNFRTVFENSHGMMCKHDLEGNFIFVNKAGADTLGYTTEEVATMSLFDLVPTEYHKGLKEYLYVIRKEGKADGLMHTRHKNGSLHIWLFNNVLVSDGKGETYVIGNATDITERHALEKDLKNTKELLERTNQVARIGGWEYDFVKDKVYWSTVTKELHEVPSDYQPDLDNGLHFVKHEEDRQLLLEVIKTTIATGQPWDLEFEITTAAGKSLWVRSIGQAEIEDNKCKKLVGTIQDINEKKKSEVAIQQSRKLLEDVLRSASEVSVIATDSHGIITLFNTGAEKLLGYKAAEIIGKKTPAFLHPVEETTARGEELSTLYNTPIEGFRIFSHVATTEGSEHRESVYTRKDGTAVITSLVVTPIRDSQEQITGYLGIAIDITERKKAEKELTISQAQLTVSVEELKKAKLQAEQASTAKSEFLANMSHEIRTPLNAVIGFTDLVLKTTLNETQHQYISIVNQSANALLSIINDILDFSKIEAGKIELDINKYDIYEFSSQASDMLSFQTQQKGLEMLLNVSADLPRFMWTDAVRLKQILVNLLGNAVKFTDRGEVELKIYPLATMPHGMTSICFEVRDTGIGIRPDKQQKIFEAFSQEDVSTTKRYGGTGLGLTISNKLLALMGSQLRLKSIPGTGSTFYFELTVRTEDGPPIVWENFDQIKNVLIVDDNKNNRMIVKNMLQLKNIQADEARNGVDAMQQLLSGQRYDVILMDYHMPYMDGLETIQKIREHEKGLHKDGAIVLLHSSSDDEKIIKASEDLQVNARLIKPIKLQEMHDTLAHLFIKDRDNKPIVPKKEEQPLRADLHVLIAEDNPINMLLATTIVKKIVPTAVVTEANNGKEAIEMCKRILPDIIFMDIQMPEVNGYEATQEIRKLTPDIRIPIIALTAGNVKGEKEKCMAAGMDDFVTKPFVEDNIVTVMNQWLPAVEL